jgi:D-alanine-D-alanine ligase
MENKKTTVAILFGGQSAEHEVSLKSTEALYNNLDKDRFEPLLIYISRDDGLWRLIDEETFAKKDFYAKPGFHFLPWLNSSCDSLDADIYFPMLHGPNGEDGKIQALLEIAGKPYVGANSVGSALAMDKVVSKILFQKAGLNVPDFLFFEKNNFTEIKEEVERRLGYPVFVKPCAMGSSVGISRVTGPEHLKTAIDFAFRYDYKILVEKALDIREIEVSVMGNDLPNNGNILVSKPGELIPFNEFYDYKDKYIDGKTTFHIPAKMEPSLETEVRRVAEKAFKTLFLNGMSRVDLFIEKNTGTVFINEINTIPGFTEISMFPKLWTLDGISFTQLLSCLIEYGFQYHQRHKIETDRGI